MQTLDTATLLRRERAEAIVTLMREITLAHRVVLEDPSNAFMSTEVAELGPMQLVHLRRSGLVMEVDRERDDCAPVVAMILGTRAPALREQFGQAESVRPGEA